MDDDTMYDYHDQIDMLMCELEEFRRDALRYRWLRDHTFGMEADLLAGYITRDKWDDRIDAAIAAEQPIPCTVTPAGRAKAGGA